MFDKYKFNDISSCVYLVWLEYVVDCHCHSPPCSADVWTFLIYVVKYIIIYKKDVIYVCLFENTLCIKFKYRRSCPLSRYLESMLLPLFSEVGLMAGVISVSRNSVIGRRNFSMLAAFYTLSRSICKRTSIVILI